MRRKTMNIETNGRGLTEITSDINEFIFHEGVGVGVGLIFIHHTSASLIISENADPNVRTDLNAFFKRLVPDGDSIYRHIDEGPDDMSAHIRSVLTATSLMIPISQGRLDLGTWQGVYIWEHRTAPHRRRISFTLLR